MRVLKSKLLAQPLLKLGGQRQTYWGEFGGQTRGDNECPFNGVAICDRGCRKLRLGEMHGQKTLPDVPK